MSRITKISAIHTAQSMTPPTKNPILAPTDDLIDVLVPELIDVLIPELIDVLVPELIDVLVWDRMQSSLQANVITASLPLTGIVNEDTDACWVSLLVSVDAVSSPLSVEKVT